MTTVTDDGERSQFGSRRPVREGLLTEDEGERVVPLKNGAQVEVALGRATYQALRGLLAREPELFGSLLARARGEPGALSEDHDARLRDALFLRPDGTLAPATRNVLLSAYRQTPDGPALVHPFRFTSSAEATQEERAEDAAWDRARRWLDDGDDPGTGGPPGRG